jgi:predicted glycoside hydrolase/deacetylase ChbG (UPF0249 family)/precorrin-6B methylase 2
MERREAADAAENPFQPTLPPPPGPAVAAIAARSVSQARQLSALGPRRTLILEADDLGLLYAFNAGIREAHCSGTLTSTCIRANGIAYRHAIEEVLPACPGLGVGIHLCLNEAAPVAAREQVPLLLSRDGNLRTGFAWLLIVARRTAGQDQIEREFRAQIERLLADGVRPDHLNSHQHVHMIPKIFRIACRLAREYGIPAVRIARELPNAARGARRRLQPLANTNYVKYHLLNHYARRDERYARRHRLFTTDYFIGVSYTGHMALATIRAGLAAVPYGSVEALLHPAIGPDPRDRDYPTPGLYQYVCAPQRRNELRSLCSPTLPDYLRRGGWAIAGFGEWVREQERNMPPSSTPDVPSQVREACDRVDTPGPLWVSAAHSDSRAFAQLALAQSQPGERVLDVGTGTGVIAICLAKFGRTVTAVDISRAAVRTASRNARRSGVSFHCHQSDLLATVNDRFDLIAFNPPYNFRPDSFATNVAKNLLRRIPWVRSRSGLAMPRGVLKFHQKLIERLIQQAPARLKPGGRVLIHAYESEVPGLAVVLPRGASVELLRHAGFTNQTVGMLIRLPT